MYAYHMVTLQLTVTKHPKVRSIFARPAWVWRCAPSKSLGHLSSWNDITSNMNINVRLLVTTNNWASRNFYYSSVYLLSFWCWKFHLSVTSYIQAHLVLLYFTLLGIRFFFFLTKLKICGNPTLSESVGTIFPKAFTHLMSVTFW